MDDEVVSKQSYQSLLTNVRKRIATAQVRASNSVNCELVLLYWGIGQEILNRQGAEGWGTKVVERLARDLRSSFPDMKGLSPRNLGYMKAFAEAWPDQTIFATGGCKIAVGS